jgi:hypothetical protein
MLKATLNVKENIEIGAFLKVIAFLKRNAVGYEAKKSKVLTREEVNTFLKEADDNDCVLGDEGRSSARDLRGVQKRETSFSACWRHCGTGFLFIYYAFGYKNTFQKSIFGDSRW